ncbi:hypothetical protein BC941DRAFT_34850 [Chlamydoabsidia padenii]|nr:hypothetical protein BC941DRAFT_34850 [Chlamydoabsidia padenii]
MSKLILLNKDVIKVVVDTLLGNQEIEYKPGPTEWCNGSQSDVVYLPESSALPPILIEIQHTVNNAFLRRLMTYALSSIRQYNSKPPILLIFAIASIKSEVRSRVKRNKNHPYLLQCNCHPWAEHCFFVDDHSLASSMTAPLEPCVALSSFFTCQARSILDHPLIPPFENYTALPDK